jgi:hypothetical protein
MGRTIEESEFDSRQGQVIILQLTDSTTQWLPNALSQDAKRLERKAVYPVIQCWG